MAKIKGAKNNKKNPNKKVNVLLTISVILIILWFISGMIYIMGTVAEFFVISDILILNSLIAFCQIIFPIAIVTLMLLLVIHLITRLEECEKKINNEILLRKLEEHKKNDKPSQGEWKCSKCGKINKDYVGICGCGSNKD